MAISDRQFTNDNPRGCANLRKQRFRGLSANGFHDLVYYEWGPSDAPVVLCVHGLTRNGRDFDFLARRFEDRFRVVCPDVAGRGESAWLADPQSYATPQYLADLNALIAHLGVDRVSWLGTSMGGLLGMIAASLPNSPVERLLINDIGPFIPRAALMRIAIYLTMPQGFPDVAAVEAHLREIHEPFGPLSDDQWAHIAQHSSFRGGDGTFRLKYDPAIAVPFAEVADGDLDLWPVWEAIDCPVTVLRGAESDLLLEDTLRRMEETGPRAEAHVVPGVGHAPALMADGQLDLVDRWLGRSPGDD